MITIICNGWTEVAKLIPTVGTKVVVRLDGKVDGEFIWIRMWNPFATEYQLVRG